MRGSGLAVRTTSATQRPLFLEHRLAGEQRGSMAVGSQPEQHDIEQRPRRIEFVGAVIDLEGRARRQRAASAGVPVDRRCREYCRAGQAHRASIASRAMPIIAVGMVRRHKALVAPEPMHPVPRHRVAEGRLGEQLVQPPRRRAARQRDRRTGPAVGRRDRRSIARPGAPRSSGSCETSIRARAADHRNLSVSAAGSNYGSRRSPRA